MAIQDVIEQAQEYIQQQRDQMKLLRVEGEKLAADGIGIPFWPEVSV